MIHEYGGRYDVTITSLIYSTFTVTADLNLSIISETVRLPENPGELVGLHSSPVPVFVSHFSSACAMYNMAVGQLLVIICTFVVS